MDTTAQNPQGLEEDESRAEATFRYTVNNFSTMEGCRTSPSFYVRNLHWEIVVMPKRSFVPSLGEMHSMGFFLQCNRPSDGEPIPRSYSPHWTCYAEIEFRVLSVNDGVPPYTRKVCHTFCGSQDDWGYSSYKSWEDLLDPSEGFIKDDAITLEVHVIADAPHGVNWDSRKHTGFVGIEWNSSCKAMSALIQMLYCIGQLRMAVYKMPTEGDESSKCVARALQRIFHKLQMSDKLVSTMELWNSHPLAKMGSFEKVRFFLNMLEKKMKGTSAEGTVSKLFEGKIMSIIKCKNIKHMLITETEYYGIRLNITRKNNLYDAFAGHVSMEKLDGDKQYNAGADGFQDAEKGVIFASFPPVLYLYLHSAKGMRGRFDFYQNIRLDAYLRRSDHIPADYTLHTVISSDSSNHIISYIDPKCDGKWLKFDYDVVSHCSQEEAIEGNFNFQALDTFGKRCSKAQMLVYVRDSELRNVLQQGDDIPQGLLNCVTAMLDNQVLTDVTLKVGGEEVKAHKIILAARSPVFAAMFQSGMEEQHTGHVDIHDTTADVIRSMLRFMYTDKIDCLEELAEPLLQIADKYGIEDLKTICANHLSETLTVENAAGIFLLASLHHVRSLEALAIGFINQNKRQVIKTERWQHVKKNYCYLIVEAFVE